MKQEGFDGGLYHLYHHLPRKIFKNARQSKIMSNLDDYFYPVYGCFIGGIA